MTCQIWRSKKDLGCQEIYLVIGGSGTPTQEFLFNLQLWQVTILQPLELWWWKVAHLKAPSYIHWSWWFWYEQHCMHSLVLKSKFRRHPNVEKQLTLKSWTVVLTFVKINLGPTVIFVHSCPNCKDWWECKMYNSDLLKELFTLYTCVYSKL